MLTKITLTNFLSYGPGPQPIDLRPLNVLIGANGSGKSNLAEALSVLRAVPRDVTLPIRRGGGVEEWVWRGDASAERAHASCIEVTFQAAQVSHEPIRYALEFGSEAGAFVVASERLEGDAAGTPYVRSEDGLAVLSDASVATRFDRTQSVLAQLRDPVAYPEVSAVGDALKRILIYRAWSFGPDANIRESCRADVETSTLLEDFSNLPARLAVLKRDPATKRRLLELLREVSPAYNDIEVTPEGGRLQLYVTEGERNVPAHRLSDGTLRYLALLAILLQPGANLVVIEEPELGLHPDMFPTLRDLLVEASERFQLVVTTHSTQLVDGLTDHAESVLVCEKENGTTRLVRLDQSDVDAWREQGALGVQWMSGRHGGTRW
jgi:predicted ATPase